MPAAPAPATRTSTSVFASIVSPSVTVELVEFSAGVMRREGGAARIRTAGLRRLDSRRRALQRHVGDLAVVEPEQPLAGEMRRRAVARTGVAVFARIGLEQRDQFLDVLHRHGRVNDDHFRRGDDERDRREALERIVRHLGLDDRLHDEILVGHQQRVAVARRVGRSAHADGAAGAGRVLDIELSAERLGELLRQDPRDDVVRTARRVGHHELHRPGRIVLRLRRTVHRAGKRAERQQCRQARSCHRTSSG